VKAMNEQDIEQMVAWSFDNLDRRYMRGQVSNEDYDREATAIEAWAHSQLSSVPYHGTGFNVNR